MRALLVAALDELGSELEIAEAENGFAALRALARGGFDLILTDVNMPDINGLELVAFARQSPQHRDCPLIVISSEGSERDRSRALELGADAYLVKPIRALELCRLSRELLARSAKELKT
jgi:two-component system chemotaxis response regulator CheY